MTLAQRLAGDGYDGYAYSYPHKTAYRPLEPPVPLGEAWSGEDRSRLFLYVHLPFCEMRCGFCNLFTTVRPGGGLVERTLAALERQSHVVSRCVRPEGVAQAAFGGGTPTYLPEPALERLFVALERDWPVRWSEIPVSLEASPGTVTASKLELLRGLGVDRLSLGAQSFVPEDLAALGRPAEPLDEACDLVRRAGFPVFNLDLIYGMPGQTAGSWQVTLERALSWRPEELYLYPLYVGPLTGLERVGKAPGARRRELYRQARDVLHAAGYQQLSMRQFRLPGVERATDYCCQEDGMVGLGPGARSYTRELHYSTEYAVGQTGVRRIIESFADLAYHEAGYGIRLDRREQKRRFLIKSLLRVEGVSAELYRARFGTDVWTDHPQLRELGSLLEELRLTPAGLERSDTIGPWLYSAAVEARMEGYQLK